MHVEWNYFVYDTGCIYGCMLTFRQVLAELFGSRRQPYVSGRGDGKMLTQIYMHTLFVRKAMLFRHYLNYIIVQ